MVPKLPTRNVLRGSALSILFGHRVEFRRVWVLMLLSWWLSYDGRVIRKDFLCPLALHPHPRISLIVFMYSFVPKFDNSS